MNVTRSKQPEVLRARILHAAQQVLLEDGFAHLTQERVLHKLDISKGGLQHHFRTKQQLLDGLFAHLFEIFAAQYAEQLTLEPDGPARHVRAYIRASLANAQDAGQSGRAITLMAINNPVYQTQWAHLLGQMLKSDALDRGTQLACQLFADGLWFSFVFGPALDSEAIDEALQKIYSLTENSHG
ncbi:MAG: TetR/AcrR family transcriptional regulator [Burkholderiaceae bacterium]|nr:TetR/AcrR family transcriptional regulator [Burkholderiaceae bacterium]